MLRRNGQGELMVDAVTTDTAENLPVKTVLMPYTTLEIGGGRISGTSLAQGLQRGYGVRSVVIAPRGAEVLRLAESLGLETLETNDKPARGSGPTATSCGLRRAPRRCAPSARGRWFIATTWERCKRGSGPHD
jgi:hypothetical protein